MKTYMTSGNQTGPTTPSSAGPCCDHDLPYVCVITSDKQTVAILPQQKNQDIWETKDLADKIAKFLNSDTKPQDISVPIYILKQIKRALPSNKDWLDPDLEKVMNDVIECYSD